MSDYIVSARKYRPLSFDDVVGQHALTQTLQNAIRQQHLAHAYLFCGPRGVGKTTCARIFAKTINCLNASSDFDACNECESCRAFNEGRSFNIHELDAASNNSVEDIRSLIDQVRIPPQIGKYSVYIIDEVHMLSQGAFNALLKTLEEPPSYAIFILATTEKHKILPTILSRCQVYDFSRITITDTIRHLQYVATKEGVNVPEESLHVVAQKADGGMRDALSIFDQLVSFCGKDITYERTIEVLNVLDLDCYFRMIDSALRHDVTAMLLLFNDILVRGFDAGNFINGLAQHMRDVLVAKDVQTLPLLEKAESVCKRYAEQAQLFSPQWIFAALDILNTCDVQYRSAKNKRLTIELALIRLSQLGVAQTPVTTQAPLQPVNNTAARPTVQTTSAAPATSRPTASAVNTATTTQRPVAAMTAQNNGTAPTATPSNGATATAATRATAPQTATRGRVPLPGSAMTAIPSIKEISSRQKSAATAAEQTTMQIAQNNPFTPDQFNDAWAGLQNHFDKEESRILDLVQRYRPVVQSQDLVVYELPNKFELEEVKHHLPSIYQFLQAKLGNNQFRIELKRAEYTREQMAYTSDEKYRIMVGVNPHLRHLSESLGLQLD